MAVDLPFPFTAKTPQELIQQTMRYFEDIYQDRIGGAQLGDVFTIGDDEVLTVGLSTTGGLEKSSKKICIYNKSDGGLASSSSGEYIKCKTGGGLATDANGAYITAAGGSNFATINCPAGTDPVAEIVGDTLNLADGSGIDITGDSATDTVTIGLDAAAQAAVTASHARQHAITATADHTSTATSGKMLKADANGLPIDASNTDTEVASAVSLKHAAVSVSAPISLSTQAISLVNNAVSPATVTAIDIDGTLAGNSDTVIPAQKAVKTYSDTKTTLAAVKADADVASAISLKHTQHTDTGTTGNTFTVDSDSVTGKIIIDVALGAADKSLTLTNEALTDNRTATFPDGTGTVYITGGTDVSVADGGTGASTLTNHGVLLGSGTGAITPMAVLAAGEIVVGVAGADPHALAAGATTAILVGGGAADPVWTAATGSGAPVRTTSPALVTPTVDHIEESTVTHGVVIDGVQLKDGGALAIVGGVNTFNLTNGTASLDIAAGAAVNIDAGLTVTVASTLTTELHVTAPATHIADGATGFTIAGGTTSKTLTVEDTSLVNQDLTSDASPTFVTIKCSGLTDGYAPKHTSDATGLENSVLYQDAASRIIAGGTTIPANDILGLNLMSHAKGQLINTVYGIVTPANVRLFLIFDQSGAVSTITDRATIGGTTAHVTTLRDGALGAINASTCTPGVSGLSPYLTLDATHLWNTPDAADLTFGTGAADLAFSIVSLINLTDATSSSIAAKWDETTGAELREWRFNFTSADKLVLVCYDESANAQIGRNYATALTGDEGTWHTYMATKNTGVTAAAIKLYRDGAQIDDANSNSGSYVAMEDLTTLVGDYYVSTAGAISLTGKYKAGVLLIVAEELTAVQVKRLDAVLRSYSGIAL